MVSRKISILMLVVLTGFVMFIVISSIMSIDKSNISRENERKLKEWEEQKSLLEKPPYEDYCMIKEDCVPSGCCHPEKVVNKYYQPYCEDIFCTAVCKGPLDCGAGEIDCINNRCIIVSRVD